MGSYPTILFLVEVFHGPFDHGPVRHCFHVLDFSPAGFRHIEEVTHHTEHTDQSSKPESAHPCIVHEWHCEEGTVLHGEHDAGLANFRVNPEIDFMVPQSSQTTGKIVTYCDENQIEDSFE